MDEIDAIGGRRFSEGTSADREIQRTLMELLNQLDGFDQLGKVIAEHLLFQLNSLQLSIFLCITDIHLLTQLYIATIYKFLNALLCLLWKGDCVWSGLPRLK